MIGAFLDESFDMKQSGIFAVGGLMGRGIATFELERRWSQLRRRADIDIEYFKASECHFGKNQFAKLVVDPAQITQLERDRLDSIGLEFLSSIVRMDHHPNSYLIAVGLGVVQDDFYSLVQETKARQVLGDSPYFLAYHAAMIQCAWAMQELGSGDYVSFVCDECERYSATAPLAYKLLKETNARAASHMGSFSSVDEKKCEPLQAADAVVYEIRRVLALALGLRQGFVRKQFGVLNDASAVFLIQNFDKASLSHIVDTHQPGEPSI